MACSAGPPSRDPASGPSPRDDDKIALASAVRARTCMAGLDDATAKTVIAIEHSFTFSARTVLAIPHDIDARDADGSGVAVV